MTAPTVHTLGCCCVNCEKAWVARAKRKMEAGSRLSLQEARVNRARRDMPELFDYYKPRSMSGFMTVRASTLGEQPWFAVPERPRGWWARLCRWLRGGA